MDTEINDQREAILANAKIVRDWAKEQLDVDLALDGESVKWLDGYIERNREGFDAVTKDRMVSLFGSYLGEALIQSIGGEWQQYKGTWCVSIDENQRAFPFNKVAKQFENGSADSIYAFFTMIPLVMNIESDPDFK